MNASTPFTLTATESALAAQYATLLTFYRFFPVAGSAGAYSTYAGPFSIAGADGTYAVNDFSLDGLNNEEAVHAQVFSLDNTPPATSIAQPAAAEYVHTATLTLDYTVDDGSGSGVRRFTPTMDDQPTVGGHGLDDGQAIDLLTELTAGTHTFSIDAVDNLGNASTRSTTFSIIVTADSIKDDVRHFLQSGAIRNSGVANSLLAKLDAAGALRAKGNCNAAANIYQAFINELQGQSGKGVDAAAAAIMIGDAQYLIDHCP